jgi:hypothetical protein
MIVRPYGLVDLMFPFKPEGKNPPDITLPLGEAYTMLSTCEGVREKAIALVVSAATTVVALKVVSFPPPKVARNAEI